MNPDFLKSLEKLRKHSRAVPTPLSLVTQRDIANLEAKLQIRLPDSYRTYLLQYSNLVIGTFEMLRPHEPDWAYLDFESNLSDARAVGLPHHLIPFLHHNGDYYCFDLKSKAPEYSIGFWSHNHNDVTERWQTFADWVEQCWIGELH